MQETIYKDYGAKRRESEQEKNNQCKKQDQ